MIARAKGRVRAQASYGNITVLSHLNAYNVNDLQSLNYPETPLGFFGDYNY